MDTASAHVIVPLEVDDRGWPPASFERVPAHHLEGDRYRIDHAPWFARDLAVDDLVETSTTSEGPVLVRVVEPSGHLTIRLTCFPSGPTASDLHRVIDAFAPLGVVAESVPEHDLVTLDIPPEAPLAHVHQRLLTGARTGAWEWEEARITDAWVTAARQAR